MKKVPEPELTILSQPLSKALPRSYISFFQKVKNSINWSKTPRNVLSVLWFLCGVQLFFDLDVLKLTPSNMYLFTNGKLRHGNIDPYLPSSLARDPTLFDLFAPNDPMPHLNEEDKPKNP